jgi:hypothetical protein
LAFKEYLNHDIGHQVRAMTAVSGQLLDYFPADVRTLICTIVLMLHTRLNAVLKSRFAVEP